MRRPDSKDRPNFDASFFGESRPGNWHHVQRGFSDAQELSKREGLGGGIWAHGYYAESLGFKNPGQIKAYIDKQSEHHAHGDLEELPE
ncbi:MAG: hypothetical protein ACP5QG_06755 [candidate division WOR-3 bacterium]